MTTKRDRELARAKFERQQVRRAQRQTRNKLIQRIVVVLAIAGVAVFFVNKNSGQSEMVAIPSESSSATAAPAPLSTNAPIDGCETPAVPRADNIVFGSEPTDLPTISTFNINTNCGDINISIDNAAPLTSGNMGWLAQQSFFNNTSCHRLTTDGIYVLQCGDPAGNGTGGPGFNFADENLPTAGADGSFVYPRGTVAMANSGANTNGSQFFLVYQDSPLPPNYSVWGTITTGLEIIDNVAAAGVLDGSSDGLPSQAVVINTVTTTP